MIKHFSRKILLMLMLISILAGAVAMPVSAADSKMLIKYVFYGNDYLDFPVSYYDGTSATARMSGMNIHYIDGKVAYCLEPQAASTANTIYSSFSDNDATFWGKKVSPAKQNAIMLAAAYGAPNKLTSSDTYTNYGYMAATQIVIWEILMDYRSTIPPYSCTNSRLYNHMIKSTGGHAEDVAGMKSGYEAINASLAAHGRIPSFAKVAQSQAETKEMQFDAATGNYTLTLTDMNNVINSDFTFSGPGVTCTKSGNALTITAPASAVQGKTVMITGVGSNPDISSTAPLVWGTQNSNGSRDQILLQYGSPDPVRVYFKVTASVASLEIVKQSDDGKISGITFTVKDSSGNTIYTGKTDNQGRINVPNLQIGQKLTVTETVPDNYVADEREQTITLTGGSNVLTFVNHPTSKLELIKQSDDGNVKGISFKLEEYEPDEGVGWWTRGTYKTDANGKISLDLKYGYKYRVTEAVPENYVSDNRVQEFTAQAGTNTLTFVNHPTCKLELLKQSDDGNVKDISFKLEEYEPEEGVGWWTRGTYKTDANGKINLDLKYGYKYRVTETVPENYVCDNRIQEFTAKAGVNTLTFVNHPTVMLELLKTSEDGHVSGIGFAVEKQSGSQYEPVGSYVTDEGGRIHVSNLEFGATYRVTETVPEGYVGDQPVQHFTAQLGTNTVRFSNRLIRGSLRIVKLDKGTEIPLQGAGYRVFNAAGEEVASDYTDENGEVVFENLAYGEYTYQEFEAPAGFVLDEAVYSFAIQEDGAEIVKQHDNQPKEGSISIYKTDEAGRPLPGVTFLLEASVDGGQTWSPICYREPESDVLAGFCTSQGLDNGTLTTGTDGFAVFSGLCIDTQLGEVMYRITETATKNGYSLLAGYAFEGSLSEESEIEVSFTVVNQPNYKMPATGGEGFVPMIIGLALAGLVGAIGFVVIRRKARRKNGN